jgi:deoxyribodipyrimidine photo-lyase
LYGETRNFIDGAVTYLSPYISRGVISTKLILEKVLNRGYNPKKIEKFIQELAWRDYWQQVWNAKGELINEDLKAPQIRVENHQMPCSVVKAKTGIEAIDKAIARYYETGYLHNHMRMYIAMVVCNIGRSHWKLPAQWMYYHLLDADWASNGLSWQWVAGSNSRKKYYANQDNINKYCHTKQRGTFLDLEYSALEGLAIPDVLRETCTPDLTTPLPENKPIQIDPTLPTLIYNFYNLDPLWKGELFANRVLLLEPSHFAQYPVSQKTIDFILALTGNIKGIRVYMGEFAELISCYGLRNILYKEHPLNKHYCGKQESRPWMFDVTGYYPSFFAFWKQCKKTL